MGNQLFTLDYRQYPNMINSMDNPNLPVKENSTQQMMTIALPVVKVTIHHLTVVPMKKRSKTTIVMYEQTL